MTLRPNNLRVYNTLVRDKVPFQPLSPPHVGMYVCGPTVYGDAHIGHAKSYVSFDVIVRYLRYLGYNVTYVQNITDVGHLTDDADQGEDKVEKKAKAERVHPMQVAEAFTRSYFEDMDRLNILRPDISPRASGHIIEQIELVKRLIASGHAYEANGSVYFDVASWPKYGKLSGRSVEDMIAGARVAPEAGKRAPADFALWKRAEPGHIMQWPSPWGMGFPGWHLECSAMSMKYLGESFDIHGGGIENQFPHHDDEIAQSEAATGKPFVKYWLHNNMVTVGGQKMGKSLGNFITLKDAFQKWDPMVLRLFILQSHYRSPLDFSDEALNAAAIGYEGLSRCLWSLLEPIFARKQRASERPSEVSTLLPADYIFRPNQQIEVYVAKVLSRINEAMDDDFNTSIALGVLFEHANETNRILSASQFSWETNLALSLPFQELGGRVLGLNFKGISVPTDIPLPSIPAVESALTSVKEMIKGIKLGTAGTNFETINQVMLIVIEMRNDFRKGRNFAQADAIRKRLDEIGIILEDSPDGTKWRFK